MVLVVMEGSQIPAGRGLAPLVDGGLRWICRGLMSVGGLDCNPWSLVFHLILFRGRRRWFRRGWAFRAPTAAGSWLDDLEKLPVGGRCLVGPSAWRRCKCQWLRWLDRWDRCRLKRRGRDRWSRWRVVYIEEVPADDRGLVFLLLWITWWQHWSRVLDGILGRGWRDRASTSCAFALLTVLLSLSRSVICLILRVALFLNGRPVGLAVVVNDQEGIRRDGDFLVTDDLADFLGPGKS